MISTPLEALLGECRDAPIRQSALKQLWSCPRKFMYEKRFGLKRPRKYASAATAGEFFHEFMRGAYVPPQDGPGTMRELLERKEHEIVEAFGQGGDPDALKAVLKRLGQDFHRALAMGSYFLRRYPAGGALEPLCFEEEFQYRLPGVISPVQGRLDLLALDKEGALWSRHPGAWYVDYKTTRRSTPLIEVAKVLGRGLQARLYRRACEEWLRDHGYEAPLLGVLHCLVRQPTILFGQEDRACRAYEHILKSGPRKGEIEVRREYEGAPDIALYQERCTEWLDGTGRYAHLALERRENPSVLRTVTLYGDATAHYEDLREELSEEEARFSEEPTLRGFPGRESHCFSFNSECAFLALCNTPKERWPEMIGAPGSQKLFVKQFDSPEIPVYSPDEEETHDSLQD